LAVNARSPATANDDDLFELDMSRPSDSSWAVDFADAPVRKS